MAAIEAALCSGQNIWKNLSLMEEAREDFRQVDEFKELESILLKKLEEDTATNNQLTERLKSVLDRFEELNSADTESTSEIVSLKDWTSATDTQTQQIAIRIKNIAAIALQEKIFIEYSELIANKKIEFEAYYEKLKNKEATKKATLSKLKSSLQQENHIQKELDQAHSLASQQFKTNREMLDWIPKSSQNSANHLALLRRQINLRGQESGENVNPNTADPRLDKLGKISDLDDVDLSIYKHIFKQVCIEAGNKFVH